MRLLSRLSHFTYSNSVLMRFHFSLFFYCADIMRAIKVQIQATWVTYRFLQILFKLLLTTIIYNRKHVFCGLFNIPFTCVTKKKLDPCIDTHQFIYIHRDHHCRRRGCLASSSSSPQSRAVTLLKLYIHKLQLYG